MASRACHQPWSPETGNDVCVDALSAIDYKGKGDPDVPQVWALTHFLLYLSEVKLKFVEGCF